MYGCSAHRIVDFQFCIDKDDSPAYQKPGNRTDDYGGDAVYESAGSSDGHQTGQPAVAGHGQVGFAVCFPGIECGDQATEGAGDHSIDDDHGRTQVAGGKGAAAIERKPAEEKDDGADDGHWDMMTWNSYRGSIFSIFADPGADYDRAGQSGDASHCVDNG